MQFFFVCLQPNGDTDTSNRQRNKNDKDMKKILAALMAGMILTGTLPATAQHHRHTPLASVKATQQTDKDGNTKASAAIVAYSDTASVDSADVDTVGFNADAGTQGWDEPYDIDGLAKLMGNAFVPIAIVFIMFFLAPVMIIALIIYFVIKSRKQKIQLAELALKNGQPIPQEVAQSKPQPNDQALWEKGVKRMFLGIGIVIFAIFIHSRMFMGIGFLVALYGAGLAVVAWTTKKKIAPTANNADANTPDSTANVTEPGNKTANGEGTTATPNEEV